MGILAYILFFLALLWCVRVLVKRSRGDTTRVEVADETIRTKAQGMNNVIGTFFGSSAAGIQTPDFGPPPPVAELEDAGAHVYHLEE